MAVTRTHFRFRIDVWTANGESIVGHVAGIEDYELVLGTFRAACEPWPGTRITLRQGTRVIEDRLAAAAGNSVAAPRGLRTRHAEKISTPLPVTDLVGDKAFPARKATHKMWMFFNNLRPMAKLLKKGRKSLIGVKNGPARWSPR